MAGARKTEHVVSGAGKGVTIAELIERRFGLPAAAGTEREANGALGTMLSHQVCRQYRPDPVPEEWLQIALAAAFLIAMTWIVFALRRNRP